MNLFEKKDIWDEKNIESSKKNERNFWSNEKSF